MTNHESNSTKPESSAAPEKRPTVRRLAPWKRNLLIASVVLTVGGIVLQGVAWATRPAQPAAATSSDKSLASGFASTGGATDGAPAVEQEPTALEEWSPVVFRLGFSFFVGFCIAYALRTFLKITLVVVGLMLLALFGLQYAGVIDVDWAGMEKHFDSVVAWMKAQAPSFRGFVTGYLPSSASGVAGMFIGFKKG